MITSRLTSQAQTTIPQAGRIALRLTEGHTLALATSDWVLSVDADERAYADL